MARKKAFIAPSSYLRSKLEVERLSFDQFRLPDSPVHVADAVMRKSEISQPHTHDYYEFFILKQGTVRDHTQNGVQLITTADLSFNAPSSSHYLTCPPSEEIMVLTNVAFPSDLFEAFAEYALNGKLLENMRTGFSLLNLSEPFLEQLWSGVNLLRYDSGSNYEAKMLTIKSLLFLIACEYQRQTESPSGEDLPDWLSNAMKAMNSADNLNAGLSRFVELCGRSQEHVNRTLQKYKGFSPTAFINSLRLQNVARLLVSSSSSITEIAFECGFNNLSHFNNVFRSVYGVSPRDYRKRQQRIICF